METGYHKTEYPREVTKNSAFIRRLARSYTGDFIRGFNGSLNKEIIKEYFNETIDWIHEYVSKRNMDEVFQSNNS
jgi:hypothetical protein